MRLIVWSIFGGKNRQVQADGVPEKWAKSMIIFQKLGSDPGYYPGYLLNSATVR